MRSIPSYRADRLLHCQPISGRRTGCGRAQRKRQLHDSPLAAKSLDEPDEIRELPLGRVAVVNFESSTGRPVASEQP
jgi:hypothetical protein